MRKTSTILTIIIFALGFLPFNFVNANSMASKLKGKILLQVESNGEAWYVNPENEKRYYLGRPADAFQVIRDLGLGISNNVFNSFNGYAPSRLSGKILIKVEDSGKAYYVNPEDLKLHYLGRPADAFQIMRELGLGISNSDIDEIEIDNKQQNIVVNNYEDWKTYTIDEIGLEFKYPQNANPNKNFFANMIEFEEFDGLMAIFSYANDENLNMVKLQTKYHIDDEGGYTFYDEITNINKAAFLKTGRNGTDIFESYYTIRNNKIIEISFELTLNQNDKEKAREIINKIITSLTFNKTEEDEDNDGLTQEQETEYSTDPKNPDTDGDGYLDGQEVINGYNPLI